MERRIVGTDKQDPGVFLGACGWVPDRKEDESDTRDKGPKYARHILSQTAGYDAEKCCPGVQNNFSSMGLQVPQLLSDRFG
jgi:hypothetical protein